MRSVQDEILILSAKGSTGIGSPQLVDDYQHLLLTLSSASSANFTVKFQGSMADDCPTFSSGQSNTNRWDYVQVKDLQNNAAIDGDTGVAFAGTDDVRQFEVNVNGLRWLCASVTARSAGTVSLRLKQYSNV